MSSGSSMTTRPTRVRYRRLGPEECPEDELDLCNVLVLEVGAAVCLFVLVMEARVCLRARRCLCVRCFGVCGFDLWFTL
jgi:hypothetical protein